MKKGLELKLMRIRCGLKLQDIANEMACTRATLSNIELGKSEHPMTLKFYELILKIHLKETFEKERATET